MPSSIQEGENNNNKKKPLLITKTSAVCMILSGKSFSSHTLKADIIINEDPTAKLLYVEVILNNVNFL